MKRILSIATLIGLAVVFTGSPAFGQDPKNKGKEDEQGAPGGTFRPKAQPKPASKPPSVQRPPIPQPSPKSSPGFPQEEPRPLKPLGKPGSGQQQPGTQQGPGPSRKFFPPNDPPGGKKPQNPPGGGKQGDPSGGTAPKIGRELPKDFNPPDRSKELPKGNNPSPFSRKPEVDPPSRGKTSDAGDRAPQFQSGKPVPQAEGGNNDSVHKLPGRPTPKPRTSEGGNPKLGGELSPPKTGKGGDEAVRRRPAPMSPSGKPRTFEGEQPKLGGDISPPKTGKSGDEAARKPAQTNPSGKQRVFEGEKPDAGGVQPAQAGKGRSSEDRPAPGRFKNVDPPSQPEAFARKGGGGTGTANAIAAKPAIASEPSSELNAVKAPRKMRGLTRKTGVDNEFENDAAFSGGKKDFRGLPENKPKRVSPAVHHDHVDVPEGGRVYSHGHYHHEYSQPSSSWFLGVGVSGGHTSLALGYSSGGWGGGPYVGQSAHWGTPWGWNHPVHPIYYPHCSYWYAPVHCHPVVYHPCYAVPVPYYYSPVYYESAIVDPYAYNSSSIAFGFGSFGGCAVSSFSFAWSSSNWGVGFGYTSAPAYTVYSPVYDPYVRSVWVDGYYELVDERVWVPGTYEEVVSTPVVETVLDPLGNTYDAVVQPGGVDYVWRDGYWSIESRRIWHPGHFEYVSAF